MSKLPRSFQSAPHRLQVVRGLLFPADDDDGAARRLGAAELADERRGHQAATFCASASDVLHRGADIWDCAHARASDQRYKARPENIL